jgi:hypothetical protein
MRVGEVVGGPTHAACWARYKRSEGDAGGVATRSGEWGCMACKVARDERTRARNEGTLPMSSAESRRATNDSALPTIAPTTNAPTDDTDDAPAAGRGMRRRANRLRRQITPEEWVGINAMQARDVKEEREGGELATLQHVLLGRCGGMVECDRSVHLQKMRDGLDKLRTASRGGGQHLQHAVAVAYAGVAAAARGDSVSAAQWEAVQRAVSGVLPRWEGVNMKARTIAQSKAAHIVWQLAEESSAHLLHASIGILLNDSVWVEPLCDGIGTD